LEKLSNNTSIFPPFRLPKRSGGQIGGDTEGVFSPFQGDLPAGKAGMQVAVGLINFNLYTFIFYLVLSL